MQYTFEQQTIIAHPGGHARIIAVAGSGKTQTLTQYICERLNQGAKPKRLLVLMYNKAAQLDFERRLKQLRPGKPNPDIRTFHSLGYRICQTLVKQGDMPPFNRKLLTDGEVEVALWRILRETAPEALAEEVLSRKKKWVEPAMAYIERVKSSLEDPEIVFHETGLPDVCQFFIEAFHRFEDWRADQARFTFSDLIYEPVKRFRKEAHLREQFGNHLAEVVVDEFQDINPVQHYLLDTLAGDTAQVLVVGDPDQTIYEFRGSKPALLTAHFSNQYTDVCDYQLSHTFRFGDQLSLLANQIIAKNYSNQARRTQCISHETSSNTEVILTKASDSALAVLTAIQRHAKTRDLADVAVINRLWANSARLELLLLAEGVPYRLDNHQTVLERHELKPFRVLLQLGSGQAQQWDKKTRRAAWQALLTQPYLKIKKSVVDQLIKELSDVSINWGRALRNCVPESLSRYQSEALFERARWIERAESKRGEAAVIMQGWITATDYMAALKDSAFSAAQVDDQLATVKAFVQFVRQRQWSLTGASEKLAELAGRKTPEDQDALLITSIHKSKGREWPVVIIPELNGRFYPYQPEGDMIMPSSAASERRLLYVAVTRAKHQLELIVPKDDGETPHSLLMPNEFVEGLKLLTDNKHSEEDIILPANMDQESVLWYAQARQWPTPRWKGKKKCDALDLVGKTIIHPLLGQGTVTEETSQRINILFDDGEKRVFDRKILLGVVEINA